MNINSIAKIVRVLYSSSVFLISDPTFVLTERVERGENRDVSVEFLAQQKRINVRMPQGKLLRTIDVRNLDSLSYSHVKDFTHVIIHARNHHDLVSYCINRMFYVSIPTLNGASSFGSIAKRINQTFSNAQIELLHFTRINW